MRLLFQIIIAALAVLGFYFILKVMSALLFSKSFVAAAVIIENRKQLESLDILISEASSSVVFSKGRRIALIVPRILLEECSECERRNMNEVAEDLGAKIYVY